MIVRFDIRPDPQGWTIFDRMTGEPAVVDGVSAVGLSYEDADELADRLNACRSSKAARRCTETGSGP
jgi:thiamine biosynthesis lipoprotein ApbE